MEDGGRLRTCRRKFSLCRSPCHRTPWMIDIYRGAKRVGKLMGEKFRNYKFLIVVTMNLEASPA